MARSWPKLTSTGCVGPTTVSKPNEVFYCYRPLVPLTAYETMGWARTAVGVTLAVAPAPPFRLSNREAPTGAALLLMRTIGIRDLVIGLGTVSAARSQSHADAQRWTARAMTSDALDVIASVASVRSVGKKESITAAAMALVFVAGDLLAMRSLANAEA